MAIRHHHRGSAKALIHRIAHFQDGPYPCEENSETLFHLRAALAAQEHRNANKD